MMVVLCSDMLLCLSLCTLYVLYIMCVHKCHYIILYLRHVLIDDGTPDLITALVGDFAYKRCVDILEFF